MSRERRRRDHFRDNNFRRRADAVRSLPLELVLQAWGANRDRQDRHRWHTERGTISIDDASVKFFNWQEQTGGGGAIDLAMHLGRIDVRAAVTWLEERFEFRLGTHSPHAASRVSASHADRSPIPRTLHLPEPDRAQLDRVRRYLTEQRRLSLEIIEPLIESGRIYADRRANAIFVMVAGKPHRPVGAELRGTGPQVWRGLAKGTRKDAGYFWVGETSSTEIILCESAIDAISCHQIHAERKVHTVCISTAGVRSHLPWLPPLTTRGYTIRCGFDDDAAGNHASQLLLQNYPSLQRIIPPAKDWNEALTRAST